MRFINLKSFCEEAPPAMPLVLCLGNFDGVHKGHRQIIKEALRIASLNPDWRCGAWLFENLSSKSHPTIFSTEQRLKSMARLGLDYAILADFDSVKSLSPVEFVEGILKKACRCVYAVCGENFRFGKGASADAKQLLALMDGNASVVPLFKVDGITVSSTQISALLERGEIESANDLLGERFCVCGPVLHGKALGRTIGYPTVNQSIPSSFPLKSGIYATFCYVDERIYTGVSNVGVRPTVEDTDAKNLETYIIDFSEDCYGKTLRIEFISRLRDEIRFSSLDALREQIAKDVQAAKLIADKK